MEIASIIYVRKTSSFFTIDEREMKDKFFFGGKEKDIPESNSTTHDKIY